MSMTAMGNVCVTEFKHGAVHVDPYKDRFAMVLATLDTGALGDGVHGDEAHLVALRKVVEAAQAIIAKIENPPPRSCNRHTDCDSADAAESASGIRAGAEHCDIEDCEDCFGQ